jgi:glycosyltransferase involved in cell wall biosynthesis
MVTVSVIIPVYNVEKYIYETIKSVLAQTYQDFEIIIVDDESPDNSIEICRSFNDSRIKIIQQKNRGLAGARNTGIRHSQGNYIALLDSDDLWLPEKLEQQVDYLENHPQVGVTFCPAGFIDDDGTPSGMYQHPKLTNITVSCLLQSNVIGSGSTPMIRREVFEAIKFQENLYGETEDFYFDEHFRRSEDLECWIRIVLQTQSKIEGISEPLVYYRVNPNSLSSDLMTQFQSWQQVVRKVSTYAPDLINEIESLATAYQLRYLSRRAIRLKEGKMAVKLINQALKSDQRILWQDVKGTLITIIAAYFVLFIPKKLSAFLQKIVF